MAERHPRPILGVSAERHPRGPGRTVSEDHLRQLEPYSARPVSKGFSLCLSRRALPLPGRARSLAEGGGGRSVSLSERRVGAVKAWPFRRPPCARCQVAPPPVTAFIEWPSEARIAALIDAPPNTDAGLFLKYAMSLHDRVEMKREERHELHITLVFLTEKSQDSQSRFPRPPWLSRTMHTYRGSAAVTARQGRAAGGHGRPGKQLRGDRSPHPARSLRHRLPSRPHHLHLLCKPSNLLGESALKTARGSPPTMVRTYVLDEHDRAFRGF